MLCEAPPNAPLAPALSYTVSYDCWLSLLSMLSCYIEEEGARIDSLFLKIKLDSFRPTIVWLLGPLTWC
jgi:hypothetical protein